MCQYAYSWDDEHWSYPETTIKKALHEARLEGDGRNIVYIGRCLPCEPGPEDFSMEGLMEDISNNFSERSGVLDVDFGESFSKKQWEALAGKVWAVIGKYLDDHNEPTDLYFRIVDSTPYGLASMAPLSGVEKMKFEAAK